MSQTRNETRVDGNLGRFSWLLAMLGHPLLKTFWVEMSATQSSLSDRSEQKTVVERSEPVDVEKDVLQASAGPFSDAHLHGKQLYLVFWCVSRSLSAMTSPLNCPQAASCYQCFSLR